MKQNFVKKNPYRWYILAVNAYAASLNVIEAKEQSYDCAFPRTWGSNLINGEIIKKRKKRKALKWRDVKK